MQSVCNLYVSHGYEINVAATSQEWHQSELPENLHETKQKMYLVRAYIFTLIWLTGKIYASNEKITDMELKCPVPEQKESNQVLGSYFLHF